MRMHDGPPETSVAGAGIVRGLRPLLTLLLLGMVRFYIAFLAPFLGGACKFYPSCSNYAWEAIERHGPGRGVLLAAKRLLRCHPFTRGGIDLVPGEIAERAPRSPNTSAIGARLSEAVPTNRRVQGEVL